MRFFYGDRLRARIEHCWSCAKRRDNPKLGDEWVFGRNPYRHPVNALTSLNNYSLILFVTHGGLAQGSHGEEPEIATGEQYTGIGSWSAHPVDFVLGHLQSCTLPNGQNQICVLPEFFSSNARTPFPQSIVYADACETVGASATGYNFALMNAFLQNGASAFLGWKDPVDGGFATHTSESIFTSLTQPNPLTIGDAYNKVNPQDPATGAILTFGGQASTTLCPGVTVALNPFGNQTGPGPYNVDVVDQNLALTAAPTDVTVTLRREVISQCSGLLFSSNRTVVVPQGQESASFNFNAGRDPACNQLPITTRYTITGATLASGQSLNLSSVPSQQLVLSVTR